MFAWLSANLGTIITALTVLLVIYGAVSVMIKDKKQGKSVSCGGCKACAMHGQCPHAKAVK